MRLPYEQVAMEVIEQTAPDAAVLLDSEEHLVGWGIVRLIRWALGRCDEHTPPSWQDVVEGPAAVKLVANAAGWRGDPEAFVSALERVAHPILERVDEGIRICGLARYDAAWRKNYPDRWKDLQATDLGGPVSERNRSEPGPVPAPQTQTQTQIQKEQHMPAAPADAAPEDLLRRLWNGRAAPELPRWERTGKARRKAARARWTENPSIGFWERVIDRLNASNFACGGGRDRWRANPDWLFKPDSAGKVLEGLYDNAHGAQAPPPPPPTCEGPDCTAPSTGAVWGRECCSRHVAWAMDLHQADIAEAGAG